MAYSAPGLDCVVRCELGNLLTVGAHQRREQAHAVAEAKSFAGS
jgi:hypothetical protein